MSDDIGWLCRACGRGPHPMIALCARCHVWAGDCCLVRRMDTLYECADRDKCDQRISDAETALPRR